MICSSIGICPQPFESKVNYFKIQLLMATTKTFKVFLCEIVAPSRRGLAAAMYYVSYSCGMFLVLFLNLFLHWRLVMVVPAIMALPIFAALYKLRDSPVWLQRMGNMRAAKEAAAFYRLSLLTLEEGLSRKMQESEKTLTEELTVTNRLDVCVSCVIDFTPLTSSMLTMSGRILHI